MEKIIVSKKNSLRKRYKLRKTGKQWLSWETTIPREVIEREAVKAGISISDFQKWFEAEWLFDNFDGLHLIFVPKKVVDYQQTSQTAQKTKRK